MKISIVDYNIGNIGSVIKAFQYIGADTESINTPEQVLKSEKLVLPGVSAFGSAMDNLNKLNLTEALREYIKKGKYFLGICIGMQLLFEESSESPEVKGLKILKGKVKRFDDPKLIVPHMGWNTISINKKSVLMNKIKPDDYFYFVHSYYCCPESEKIILTFTEYGNKFCSAIESENITAFQFHPEKSQNNGLILLQNFLKLQ